MIVFVIEDANLAAVAESGTLVQPHVGSSVISGHL